jgi:transposase
MAAGALDVTRARALVAEVRAAVETARGALVELWHARAWETLGYESWEAMCTNEFGMTLHLPREQRRELVADLTAKGMSTRAIAPALGVTDVTVRRDRGATNVAPANVVGLDGKPYAKPVASKGGPVSKPQREGVTTWSRRVQTVSAKCPMDELTPAEIKEIHGAATFLRDYCQGELIRRDALNANRNRTPNPHR